MAEQTDSRTIVLRLPRSNRLKSVKRLMYAFNLLLLFFKIFRYVWLIHLCQQTIVDDLFWTSTNHVNWEGEGFSIRRTNNRKRVFIKRRPALFQIMSENLIIFYVFECFITQKITLNYSSHSSGYTIVTIGGDICL